MVGSSVNFASVSCVRRCLDRERAALIGMMHGDRRYEGSGEAWRRGGLVTIECAGAACGRLGEDVRCYSERRPAAVGLEECGECCESFLRRSRLIVYRFMSRTGSSYGGFPNGLHGSSACYVKSCTGTRW